MKHRPWGPIDWALSLSSQKQWHFVGALGTEERSLCSWSYLKQLGVLVGAQFGEVQDIDSDKYRDRTQAATAARRAEFSSRGGDFSCVEQMELMAELFVISAFTHRAANAGQSIILDITSFPKRFFFPILRDLANNLQVRDLIVTYTSPKSYAPEAEPLYEDIEPWKVMPGFGIASSRGAQWVVSVGFLVESLRRYVGDNPNKSMKVLVPFPAPLFAIRRTWEAVSNLEQGHAEGRFDKFRVDTLDMSAAFDRICSLAGNPERPLAFAPFGPKPTSAAMCLYSIQKGSSVHYPQPTIYHPEYSCGIRHDDPATAISAYWIKHGGESLYQA
jgi:hypothetical protein